MAKRKHPANRNPVAAAILKVQITRDVAKLVTAAETHAWNGDNAARLIQEAGSLLYIVSHAAGACRLDPDSPDMRIVRGMASAIADLAADHGAIEQHRPALQSGLLAIERILPRLNPWALGLGAVELDQAMAAGGFGVQDVFKLQGIKEAA